MKDPTSNPDTQRPRGLRDEIAEIVLATSPSPLAEGDAREKACAIQADAIMHLLAERGHYLPGCPPAAQILRDAESFAGQLTLAVLCVRLLRLLESPIQTPETKGARRWLSEYIDGKNHGPVGRPMLWPSGLPGLAAMLREWGYQPTPTHPPFVARRPNPMGTIE